MTRLEIMTTLFKKLSELNENEKEFNIFYLGSSDAICVDIIQHKPYARLYSKNIYHYKGNDAVAEMVQEMLKEIDEIAAKPPVEEMLKLEIPKSKAQELGLV